jgi:alcohol dehydrogenase class IV
MYTFQTAQKIVFGAGALRSLGEEARRFGDRALILCDRRIQELGFADRTRELLQSAGLRCEVRPEVLPEPPMNPVAEQIEACRRDPFDLYIGLGGGSSIDVAKLVAALAPGGQILGDVVGVGLIAERGRPVIAIPTTSGTGAEATPNAIVTDTEQKLKKGIVSPYLLPEVALVDPELTVGLPPALTAATGIDALAHAVESYTSNKANPLSDMPALEATRRIAGSLRAAYADGADIEARENMALGSLLGGMALTNSGTTAVHALAYPLGGMFGVAHGVANAALLRHVMAFNAEAAAERFAEVARCFRLPVQGCSTREAAQQAVDAIAGMVKDVGIPASLREFGVGDGDLEDLALAASKVTRLLDNNPRSLSLKDIEGLYAAAMG